MLILLVGVVLRLEHITQPFADKFSWRETSTAMMAQNFYRGNWNIFYPEVDWGGPGPNFQGREFQTITYIAAIFYNFFGQHEWVSRGVTVAFGIWGTFALYQLVRRVWDRERALVSAGLMAVLPGAVCLDRSFLPDPAMGALLITSLWMLVAYCQTDKLGYLIGAAILGSLGILTKLPGIIVGLPAGYAVYSILGRQALYRQKLISLVVAGFSVLLVVSAYYLWARHLSLTYPPYHFAGAHKFISFAKISDWIVNYYFLSDLSKQLFGWLWTWPVVILAVIGLLLVPRKGEQSEPGIQAAPWFWHWFGAALVIDYLIEAQHLVEDPNNMYLYVPFAAAMAGNAVLTVARLVWRERFHARKVIAITVIIVIVGLVGRQQIKPLYEPHYAASYHLGVIVNKIADPNDLIVSVGLNPCTIYYSRLRGWLFPPTEIWHTRFGWDYAEHDIEALKSLWKDGAKWLVISNTNDEYRNANDLKNGRGGTLWPYIAGNFALYHESEDGMIFQLPPYPHRRG
jgi:Dolichyl-phosphate-mannose-protein mannosyltransferase